MTQLACATISWQSPCFALNAKQGLSHVYQVQQLEAHIKQVAELFHNGICESTLSCDLNMDLQDQDGLSLPMVCTQQNEAVKRYSSKVNLRLAHLANAFIQKRVRRNGKWTAFK